MISNKKGSEIILRPNQFCNLSEGVVRANDTLDILKEKVRKAAILGTLQATLTDFKYLRPEWKKNTEEEALLGVSLTGIMDNKMLSGRGEGDAYYCHSFCGDENITLPDVLTILKQVAIDTNKEWAKKLGINQATAITAVKPSGTVSQLVDSASGIHPRFSDNYIRRVRADIKDPLALWMVEQGFPYEVDVMKASNYVFEFPIKAPEEAITVADVGAMDQLKIWKIYQDHWCEHKPSITVYYTDEEFMEIGNWLWKHFDDCSGISFLPVSDHSYQQAPYEAISESRYEELLAVMPQVDWSAIQLGEKKDNTVGSQTMACSGGTCEIVDL